MTLSTRLSALIQRVAFIAGGWALFAAMFAPGAHAAISGTTRVASGLAAPMFTTFAPGDPTRLFIAERGGSGSNVTANIRVLDLTTGVLQTTPYLSVTGLNTNGEGGLLGLAFHPDFMTNGKLYVNVTANDSVPDTPFSTYIREYTAPSPTATSIPTSTAPRAILQFTQPQNNHNGGFIGFGPKDGYLYVMTGDGGNGNDQGTGHTEPNGNAQDLTNNLLGKVLRVDVDRDDFPTDNARNYGIPLNIVENDVVTVPGNPFVAGSANPAGDDEIWAYGLRNPFRAGFDRVTGDLWIGDVGQGAREEVDFQPGDSDGGENYGWRFREGTIQTPGSVGGPKPVDNVDPIYDYRRPGTAGVDANYTGTTVVGGVPYRGPDPSLQGTYIFADTNGNKVWSLERPSGGGEPVVTYINPILTPPAGLSPSGPVAVSEDAIGNLYITYLYSGEVYRINTTEFRMGDFSGDGVVDAADLNIWSSNFGTASGATRARGDDDADGDVDGADFLAWQRNLGASPFNLGGTPQNAAVPEPTALLLAALCLGCAAASRRRGNRRANGATID